ncbi:hypothetical protein [Pseudomonas sp. 37 R 15]|nr:hypothetical protein [Pseudomonas sp. 37 R 15]
MLVGYVLCHFDFSQNQIGAACSVLNVDSNGSSPDDAVNNFSNRLKVVGIAPFDIDREGDCEHSNH